MGCRVGGVVRFYVLGECDFEPFAEKNVEN
jgi:hypothetical protein